MKPKKLSMRELAERFAFLDPEERWAILLKMSPAELLRFDVEFEAWCHEQQLEPPGEGWRTWLMMAGRGFGKTRAGAEWVTGLATQRNKVRIALVGASEDEVRKIMIEGESGLLAVGAIRNRRPRYEPSLGRLRWPGGSEAYVYSGENPDGLRGPQHHFAWCDELAKWAKPDETWDNLQLTLRAGLRPRALVTTTPRSIPLLTRIEASKRTAVTRGRTCDNLNLPSDFAALMAETYGGTRLGRQELDGELIEDVEGALWTRATVEKGRVSASFGTRHCEERSDAAIQPDASAQAGLLRSARNDGPELRRVVVGVDPPASASGDECGIVVCGLGADGVGYVLADCSVGGLSPEGWARAVVLAAETWSADRVVVETNQGGEMVEAMLRGADCALPVKPVHARFGKGKRAEPVAQRFETGKAKFAGTFPELEDQLCGLTRAGGYEGPGRSPDRADAMVWAMTELLLAVQREPRIRQL